MSLQSGLPRQDAFCFKCCSDLKEVDPGFRSSLLPNDLQDGGGEECHTEFCFFWQVGQFKREKARASDVGDICLDDVQETLANIKVEITIDESMDKIFIFIGAVGAQRRGCWGKVVESLSTDQEFV